MDAPGISGMICMCHGNEEKRKVSVYNGGKSSGSGAKKFRGG